MRYVLFVGHRQTVQPNITRRIMQRIIRISTVFLQNVLLKFEFKKMKKKTKKTKQYPLKWKWVGPIIRVGNSIRLKWVMC